jgi:hypothetical protein
MCITCATAQSIHQGLWRHGADPFIGPSIDDAIDTVLWLQWAPAIAPVHIPPGPWPMVHCEDRALLVAAEGFWLGEPSWLPRVALAKG